MGLKKLEQQLKDGKITKKEFAERKAQSIADAKHAGLHGNVVQHGGGKTKPSKPNPPNRVRSTMSSQPGRPQGPGGSDMRLIRATVGREAADLMSSDFIKYLCCVLAPENSQARIPDGVPRRSSLLPSSMELLIQYNTSWTADLGRFALIVSPKFGNPAGVRPIDFKVMLADGVQASWHAAPWTNNNAYGGIVNNRDPRIEKWMPFMSVAAAFFFNGLGSTGCTITNILGTAANVTFTGSYNLNTQWGIIATGVGGTLMSCGNYMGVIVITGTTLSTITPNIYNTNGALLTPGSQTYALTITRAAASNDQTMSTCEFLLTMYTPGYLAPSVSGATLTSGSLVYSSAISSANNFTQNFGAIERIRPVSLSVMVTNTVGKAAAGGQIAGCRLMKEACVQSVFTESTGNNGVGNLQNWEALSVVQGAKCWDWEEGMRITWSPQDASDFDFLTPDEFNFKEYACLMFAGQFVPSQSNFPGGQIAKICINSVYEYTTNYQMFQAEQLAGWQMTVDAALGILNQFPSVTTNPGHMEAIRSFLSKAMVTAKQLGQFAWAHKEQIGSLAAGVAAIL